MVGGSRGNVRALLESGELLMIFPERNPRHQALEQRYQLQEDLLGACGAAIRNRV